jgi:FSR family fosmidomycin resistance protein-like MFS transporter
MVASQVSQSNRTRATALFFTAGQLGLFLGPILAGLILERFDRGGYVVIPLLSLLAFGGGWLWVANPPATRPPTAGGSAPRTRLRLPWALLVPLALVIITTNVVSLGTINFAPKLFTERGYPADYVGWMAGLFMMGSAFGGMAGGWLGDRFGGKWAIALGVLGCLLPIYFYIPAPDPWRFLLLALAGFFGGMPHSILVLMAQALLPGRGGLAAGLTLGFMFTSGAIGVYVLGIVADRSGLANALQGMAILLLLAAGAALALPAGHSRRA